MAQNSKDEIILQALLSCSTIKQASEVTGIPEPTIYSKLRNDNFKLRYNEAKRRILDGTVNMLRSQLQSATATIINIMNDTSVAAQTRLNAARSVFDYSIKLTEQTEIFERLEALELGQRDE